MSRPTKRRHPKPRERRNLRLAALRSWEVGETLDDVAARLHVRPGWLYDAIKHDIAVAQRHFGRGVTAELLATDASLELHLTRDGIAPRSARNFAAYCIRRLYARQDLERERRRRRALKEKPTDEFDQYIKQRDLRRRERQRQLRHARNRFAPGRRARDSRVSGSSASGI